MEKMVSLLSRAVAGLFTSLLKREDVTPVEESAWSRGVRDARRWVSSKPLGLTLLCGMPGSAVAALAAVLTETSTLALHLLAGAGGFLAGVALAMLGLLAVQLAMAPVRQRNEARAQLAPSTADGLSEVADELDAFVVAEKATRPRGGLRLYMDTLSMGREDSARVMAERNAEADRGRRQTLRGYHERFRGRVIGELEQPGREPLLQAHGDTARDPKHLGDIQRLSRMLTRLARVRAERAGALDLGDMERRAKLAADIRSVAGDIESMLRNQDQAVRQLAGELQERRRGAAAATAADRGDFHQGVEREQHELHAALLREFDDRCRELVDRAQAMSALGQDEGIRLDDPKADVDSIASWLRDLATELDGQPG